MRLSRWFGIFLLAFPLLSTPVLADYPNRGMNMGAVKAQYGQPQSTRQSTGPVRKQWPRITVWNYGSFSVYFERNIVLHTVLH